MASLSSGTSSALLSFYIARNHDKPYHDTSVDPARRRHEFLGPSPFVAGYQFDAGSKTARIEWWDPYIDLKWTGRGIWKVEVYFDETVEGYVTRPRGDFDTHSPDLQRYLGLK